MYGAKYIRKPASRNLQTSVAVLNIEQCSTGSQYNFLRAGSYIVVSISVRYYSTDSVQTKELPK